MKNMAENPISVNLEAARYHNTPEVREMLGVAHVREHCYDLLTCKPVTDDAFRNAKYLTHNWVRGEFYFSWGR